MGNFCNVANFTLYLLICKFVTCIYIKSSNIIFCIDSQRKCERAK